jgi:lipoprotein-releasing system permease protein
MLMSYELFIGLRYLKAKRKQFFISIITLISITGVFLGVMALIIVLAVMNGFETDIKEKILGTYSHIILLKHGEGGISTYSGLPVRLQSGDAHFKGQCLWRGHQGD